MSGKRHYYVGVFYGCEMYFVTEYNLTTNTWFVDPEEEPKEMPEAVALSIADGITANGRVAVTVSSCRVLRQPGNRKERTYHEEEND